MIGWADGARPDSCYLCGQGGAGWLITSGHWADREQIVVHRSCWGDFLASMFAPEKGDDPCPSAT